MCDPVSIGIASIGLNAGSQIAGYISQKREANRVNAENEKYVAQNKQASIDAAMYNEAQLSLRQSEEILSASSQIRDMELEGEANKSTATVAAKEAGVSGNSLDAVLNDIQSKTSADKSRTRQNLKMRQDQLQREKEGVLVDAQNNINTVRQTVVRGPSLLTPVFATGSTVLGVIDQNRDRNARASGGKP